MLPFLHHCLLTLIFPSSCHHIPSSHHLPSICLSPSVSLSCPSPICLSLSLTICLPLMFISLSSLLRVVERMVRGTSSPYLSLLSGPAISSIPSYPLRIPPIFPPQGLVFKQARLCKPLRTFFNASGIP